jgi:hypothetical protein
MARKKTLEELRATNRVRQKRWREAHRWLAEQRRLSLYGKSEAQKKLAAAVPVTHNAGPEARNAIRREEREERIYDADPTDGRTLSEKREQEALQAYRRRKGGKPRRAEKSDGVEGIICGHGHGAGDFDFPSRKEEGVPDIFESPAVPEARESEVGWAARNAEEALSQLEGILERRKAGVVVPGMEGL